MKLDIWYKSKVEKNTLNPPESVWEGVQNELDIDLVWSRIDAQLDAERKSRRLFYISAAAGLLILIALAGLVYFISFKPSRMNEQFVKNEEAMKFKDSTVVQEKNVEPMLAENDQPKGLISSKTTSESHRKATLHVFSEPEKNSNGSTDSSLYQRDRTLQRMQDPVNLNLTYFLPLSVEPSKLTLAEAEKENPLPEKNPYQSERNPILQSLYVGFSGQLANTLLINAKTIESFDQEALVSSEPSVTQSVGLLLGTKLNDRFALQAEYFIIGQNKHSYNEYVNGKYINETIQLNYQTLTAQTKYRLMRSKAHQLAAGVYLGSLTRATQTTNGLEEDIIDTYKKIDYGLLLGYEYPVVLTKRLTFTSGVFAKVGLRNVFSGTEIIPDYLNKTQNTSVNISFALSYSLF